MKESEKIEQSNYAPYFRQITAGLSKKDVETVAKWWNQEGVIEYNRLKNKTPMNLEETIDELKRQAREALNGDTKSK